MKTYKKGPYFYIELPDDLLEDYDDELDKILHNTITLNKCDIVVDLRNISYLSSFTLRVLMKRHKEAIEIGRNLAIINIDDELAKFVETSHIDSVLPIYKDENEFAKEKGHMQPHPTECKDCHFTYTIREQEEIVIASISGVLEDVAILRNFEEAIFSKIKIEKTRFIFDLQNLDFIDSLSIGRFVKLNKLLLAKKGKLIFCCPNELVRDFLTVLGLTELIIVCETLNEALQIAKTK